jgi:hypothetical protein
MTNTPLSTWVDPATGAAEITYNGYTFPVKYNAKITSRPQYDPAGRSRIFTRYTIEVYGLVTSTETSRQNNSLLNIRRRLQQPGGVLKILGLGFGDIDTSPGTGGQLDVEWGPKPQLMTWNPIGTIAAEVVWTCEVALVDCFDSSSQYYQDKFLSFNFESAWTVNERGYTTRSISGSYTVAGIRLSTDQSAMDMEFSANAWWQRCYDLFPIPSMFKRTRNEHTISANGVECKWGLEDAEIEADNAFPWGIVDGDFDMDLSNKKEKNFVLYGLSVSANIERSPSAPPGRGIEVWFLTLNALLQRFRERISLTPDPKDDKSVASIIPTSVKFKTGFWNRIDTFAASFQVVCDPGKILIASGMWDAFPADAGGGSWDEWMGYARVTTYRARGSANLASPYAFTDVVPILDICGEQNMSVGGGEQQSPGVRNLQTSAVFDCNVREGYHYTDYKTMYQYGGSQSMSVQTNAEDWSGYGSGGAGESADPSTTIVEVTGRPANDEVVYHGPPVQSVKLVGSARTVKYQPTIPKLVSSDGFVYTETDRVVNVINTSGLGGSICPTWRADWVIYYRLTTTPQGNISTPLVEGGGAGSGQFRV